MATDIDTLVLQLVADQKATRRSLTAIRRDVSKTSKSMERQFNRSFDRSLAGFNRMSTSITRGLGAIGLGLGAREVQRYADAWTEAGNKVAAASQVADLQGRSLENLNELADRNRAGLTETVDLYSRLLRSTKGVAQGEEEVARATEIAIKAFKAGGASATEFRAGVLQLGQALGSGFLQGDELRSLRENAPLVAQAIAKEFNVTIGELKKLGAEGALTSDRVFKAILKAQPEIEAAFARTSATIGDGFTKLRNALTEYIAAGDESIGATDKLIAALGFLSENLNTVLAVSGLALARGILPLAGGLLLRLAPAAATASAALQLLAVRGGASYVASNALAGAIGFLGGPLGAAIALGTGFAFALSQMETNAEQLRGTLDGLSETTGSLNSVNSSLASDYAELEIALKDLAEAQRLGGQAAVDAATLEVSAINSRINANKLLRQELTIIAQARLNEARSTLSELEAEELASAKVRAAAASEAAAGFQNINDAVEYSKNISDSAAKAFIASEREKLQALVATGEELTKQEAEILESAAAVSKLRVEFIAAEEQLALLGQASETANDEIGKGKDLAGALSGAVSGINFANAIDGAADLAAQLGVSLSLARQIAARAGSSGVGDEVFDPRSSKFDPEAQRQANRETELQRIRDENAKIDAEIKKRESIVSRSSSRPSGGGASPQATETQRQYNEALSEASRLLESNLTAEERLAVALQANTDLYPALIAQIKAEAAARGETISQAEAEKLAKDEISQANKRLIDEANGLQDASEKSKNALKSNFEDVIVGAKSVEDALKDVLVQLARMAAKRFVAGIFGGGGGGGGLGKVLGFAEGGYTGNGAKMEPKGVVHGGEYVFSKEATSKAGVANLDALHKNLKGFSGGGFVGPSSSVGQASQMQPQRMELHLKLDAPEGVSVEQVGEISQAVSLEVTRRVTPSIVSEFNAREG